MKWSNIVSETFHILVDFALICFDSTSTKKGKSRVPSVMQATARLDPYQTHPVCLVGRGGAAVQCWKEGRRQTATLSSRKSGNMFLLCIRQKRDSPHTWQLERAASDPAAIITLSPELFLLKFAFVVSHFIKVEHRSRPSYMGQCRKPTFQLPTEANYPTENTTLLGSMCCLTTHRAVCVDHGCGICILEL